MAYPKAGTREANATQWKAVKTVENWAAPGGKVEAKVEMRDRVLAQAEAARGL